MNTMNKKIQISSNKNFGIVFSIFFATLFIYYFINYAVINYILIFLSAIFLYLGMIKSKLLTPLNMIWFKFGIFLGKIISPIVMGIIFFGVITPISLIMKILKKDVLNLKYNNSETYWIKKEEPISKMKNQF